MNPVEVIKLNPDLVRRIHTRIMNEGELLGEYEGRLEGALSRLQARLDYNLGIDDVFDVAGCYAAFITEAHAFADGNKRTAFRASIAVLGMNGINPKFQRVPDEPYYDMIIECAKGNRGENEIAGYLRALHSQFMIQLEVDIKRK